MIVGDVQGHADVGAKRSDGFQLKAGKLQHVPLSGARGLHHRGRRRADVAAHLRGDAGFPQDVAGERRGGGLAVRAGDADRCRLAETSSASSRSPITGTPRRARLLQHFGKSAGTPGESTTSSASSKAASVCG